MSLYNLRNPAVKRLMREADELKYPTEEYFAQPLEDNLFEWHFTLRGPPNTEFEGGIYHGRITLPPDYPMKPPSIILLTPNGRFETNKKVCLSISGHHPESWRPSWSIRTALLAIIGFLPTHGNGAIGSLDYTPEERKKLALRCNVDVAKFAQPTISDGMINWIYSQRKRDTLKWTSLSLLDIININRKSQDWKCQECGYIRGCLKSPGVEKSENCDIQNNDMKFLSEPISNSSSVENVSPDDEYSGRGSDSENSSSTSSTDFAKNIPGNSIEIVTSNEDSAVVLRQRNFDSNECIVESMQPSTSPVQSVRAKSVQNNCSLIVIWVISLILVLLIIRRWFSFDYTV